jgi:predicted  nucleic acid-binding Zn-ribbon protein
MYGQNTGLSASENSQLKSVEVSKPMTDIESAFVRLNEELEGAEKRVASLRDKLRPVMAEVPQNKDDEADGYGGSPLAQEIEQRTQRVRQLNKELAFILDSLQL